MFRAIIQLEMESNPASFIWTQKDFIWLDLERFAQESKLESMIIIGENLKQVCNPNSF